MKGGRLHTFMKRKTFRDFVEKRQKWISPEKAAVWSMKAIINPFAAQRRNPSKPAIKPIPSPVMWREGQTDEREVEVDLGQFGTIRATLKVTTITYTTGREGPYYEYSANLDGKEIRVGNWQPNSALDYFRQGAIQWLARNDKTTDGGPYATIDRITGLRWTGD